MRRFVRLHRRDFLFFSGSFLVTLVLLLLFNKLKPFSKKEDIVGKDVGSNGSAVDVLGEQAIAETSAPSPTLTPIPIPIPVPAVVPVASILSTTSQSAVDSSLSEAPTPTATLIPTLTPTPTEPVSTEPTPTPTSAPTPATTPTLEKTSAKKTMSLLAQMLADPNQLSNLYEYFSQELGELYSKEEWEQAVAKSGLDIASFQLVGQINEMGNWATQEMKLVAADGQEYLFLAVLVKENGEWKLFGTE